MRSVTILLGLVLILLLCNPIFPHDAKNRDRPCTGFLPTHVEAMAVTDRDITDTLERLVRHVRVGRGVSGSCTFSVRDVSPKDLWDLILLSHDLAWEKREVCYVMTRAEYEKKHGVSYPDERKVKAFQLTKEALNDAVDTVNDIKSDQGRVIMGRYDTMLYVVDTRDKLKAIERALTKLEGVTVGVAEKLSEKKKNRFKMGSREAEDIRMRLKGVNVRRFFEYEPAQEPAYRNRNIWDNTLSCLLLLLEVRGDGLEKIDKYGKYHIESAVDDTGKTLHLLDNYPNRIEDLGSISVRRHFDGEVLVEDIEIALSLPDKNATEIKEVKGSIMLVVGGQKRVVIPDVFDKEGQEIDDPDLKKAGLKIRIVPKAELLEKQLLRFDGTVLGYEVSGIEENLLNHNVMKRGDPYDKYASTRTVSREEDGEIKTIHIARMRRLDTTDLYLRLEVLDDATLIKIPFHFKNIKLE